MFLGVVHGVEQAKYFLDATPEVQVVDRRMLEDSILVDDEEAAQRDAGSFHQDAIVSGDLLVQIRDEGIVAPPECHRQREACWPRRDG